MGIRLHSWVATRVFRHKTECRAVISNERDHEFLALEDASALLWGAIADNPGICAEKISENLNFPLGEVREFIAELVDAGLLALDEELSSLRPKPVFVAPQSQAPTSGRNESGTNVESVPGGDNLEAEFEFQDWARERGYLWATAWELTYRCNESCVHCFNPGASHKLGQHPNRKTLEMTKLEWLPLLEGLKDLGVFRLLLTGGEVSLRKDFFEILTESRLLGFSVTVFTNGTLFDAHDLDRLIALYPHRVELSIYAAAASLHDEITRLPKSFEKTIAAAKYLRAANVTVALKMAAMKNTVSQVNDFRTLCDELDCEAQIDFNMSPGLDGARDPVLDLLPEPISLIREAANLLSPLYVGTPDDPRKQNWKELEGRSVCGAGLSTMSVSPEGNIYPCASLPLYVGSVREEGIAAIWRGSKVGGKKESTSQLSQWQKLARKDYVYCGSFPRCEWCHKCPGQSFLETGNELMPSLVNCRNAAARLIAYSLVCEGIDPMLVDDSDVLALQLRFCENTALWQTSEQFSSQISLESVRSKLKDRAKISVLLQNP